MIRLDPAACNGCNTCAKVCPHGVIAMVDRCAVLRHEDRCIECGACSLNCREGAIEVTKGTGCLVVIVKEDLLGMKPGTACC